MPLQRVTAQQGGVAKSLKWEAAISRSDVDWMGAHMDCVYRNDQLSRVGLTCGRCGFCPLEGGRESFTEIVREGGGKEGKQMSKCEGKIPRVSQANLNQKRELKSGTCPDPSLQGPRIARPVSRGPTPTRQVGHFKPCMYSPAHG